MENTNFTGLILATLIAYWMFRMGEDQKKKKKEEQEEKDKNEDTPPSKEENTKEP